MISASVPDPALFSSGRQFAAWLGLTPKPHSSGGKERLGGISKQGDGTIRRLLVVGATAMIRTARRDTPSRSWAKQLLEHKPARLVSVGAGQQDRADRLGGAGARRSLQGGSGRLTRSRLPASTVGDGGARC